MERITLVTVHNAFDRTGRDTKQIDSGLTLEDIRTLHLPAAVDFALSINGRTVTDLTTIPRAGDMITAVPVLSGSDDGKMIGRLIGMIIIAVVAWYAAPALALAFGASSAGAIGVANAAIMMVGGLLINTILAPKGGAVQTYGNSATDSPSYSWAPQSTQQQGTVLPRWYGKNKLYGNITVGHITYSGSGSYINALVNLGMGPYNKLYDYQVNDQPISNFTGVTAPEIQLGYLNQKALTNFKETAVEYSTSMLVTHAAPVIYTTQGNDFDALEILVQLPSGLGAYNDQGALTTLSVTYVVSIKKHSDSVWTIISQTPVSYGLSTGNYWSQGWFWRSSSGAKGDWYQIAVGSTDKSAHYEGEVVLPRPDVNNNNQIIWHWIAPGTNQITAFNNFVTITGAQTTPLKVQHQINTPDKDYYDIKVERVTDDFTDARQTGQIYLAAINEITTQAFTYPRQVVVGLKALATNQLSGSLRFSCMGECAIIRVWDGANWLNRYSTNPAWICYDVLTQPVLSHSPAQWLFENELCGWTAENAILTQNLHSVTLAATTADPVIKYTDLSYDGNDSRYIKVQIKRLAGSGWQGTCYFSTPNHGFAETFRKTVAEPVWTGNYVELVFDMWYLSAGWGWTYQGPITGLRFDFGATIADIFEIDSIVIGNEVPAVLRYDGIDPSRIDYAKFKEWADYCDELLPDGNGGTEKRIEFNGGFDSEMSLWEAALRICTTAYATPIWNGIRLTVAIDKPADPVQLFSLGNIDQDSFKENFLPMEDRAAEIEIDFVNEENGYQRDKLSVINTNMTTVTSKVNLTLFGITKPSMAWRVAMRKLAYNQLISRTIEFGADIDSIACTVGDVILVQHDVPQWGYGGRLVSATTAAVTIDQIITLQPGVQYAILVRMGDDSLVERDITNAPGDATVLTVSPAFTAAPSPFDVFTVGEILKTAKPFRVSDIARDGDLNAKLSAVEYVEGVYNVDYDLPVTAGLDYSQPLTSYKQSLPPFENIIGLTVTESLRKYNSGQVSAIATIYWTPVVNRYAFPTVELYAWQDGSLPQKISNTPIAADSFEWPVPVDGVYWNFVVACVNLNGESQSIWPLIPYRTFITGKTAPPGDVTNFYATPVITGGLRFAWTPPPDLDVQGFIIKYSPLTAGASWHGASELMRTAALYANLNIAQPGTYMIKAFDMCLFPKESAAADEVVVSTVPSNVGLTPHTLIEEHPAWGGTKTNFTLASGEIHITGSGTTNGVYVAGTAIDFGEVKQARVVAQCNWRIAAGGANLDSLTNLDSWVNIDGPTGNSTLQTYIYTSQDGSAPTFKQPLFAGDYAFQRAYFTIEAYEHIPDLLTVHSLTINVDLHETALTI